MTGDIFPSTIEAKDITHVIECSVHAHVSSSRSSCLLGRVLIHFRYSAIFFLPDPLGATKSKPTDLTVAEWQTIGLLRPFHLLKSRLGSATSVI